MSNAIARSVGHPALVRPASPRRPRAPTSSRSFRRTRMPRATRNSRTVANALAARRRADPPRRHVHADLPARDHASTAPPTSPITIRAADGETPIVTRPQPANFSYDQNNIEIVNSSYLIIRGLHFKGGDGGVSFIGGPPHHLRGQRGLRDREQRDPHEQRQHGLVRHPAQPHPPHRPPGRDRSGTTEGEGLYVGCNDAHLHRVEPSRSRATTSTTRGGPAAAATTESRSRSAPTATPCGTT